MGSSIYTSLGKDNEFPWHLRDTNRCVPPVKRSSTCWLWRSAQPSTGGPSYSFG